MLLNFRRPFRGFSSRTRRSNTRHARSVQLQAEVLESRAPPSATFSTGNTIEIGLSESSAAEVLTVAESGSDYVFSLAAGVWTGTDGGGFSGAGTNTLTIDKAEAASRIGGIQMGVDTLVDFDTADFSSLKSLFVGAADITQDAGETLTTSLAILSAQGVTHVEGTIVGTTEQVQLLGGRRLFLDGATISTTSGRISLNGGIGGGNWIGVTMIDTQVSTETGEVSVIGWGGNGASSGATLNHTGLYISESRIESTGVANAGGISIRANGGTADWAYGVDAILAEIVTVSADILVQGNDPNGVTHPVRSTGVRLQRSLIESATGDIVIYGDSQATGSGGVAGGGDGVAVLGGSSIRSTGTGIEAGRITIQGNTSEQFGSRQFQSGVFIGAGGKSGGEATVSSTDGAIVIRGAGGMAGVTIGFADVTSATGSITVLADSMSIADGFLNQIVVSSSGTVTLSTLSADTPIVLGGTTAAFGLHLSDAELDRIEANVLQIGRMSHTGGVRVVGLIDQPANDTYETLAIVTGGVLTDATLQDDGGTTYGKLQVYRLVVNTHSTSLGNAGPLVIPGNCSVQHLSGELAESHSGRSLRGNACLRCYRRQRLHRTRCHPRHFEVQPHRHALLSRSARDAAGADSAAHPQRRQRCDRRHLRWPAGRNADRDCRRSPGSHHLSGEQARWNERRGHRTARRTFRAG